MKSPLKAPRFRRYLLVVLALLGVGYALKDHAVEFWEDELDTYERLEEAQFVPVLTAKDLTKKHKIGVLIFGDAGVGTQGQHDVADGMWNLCKTKPCALAIGLGDNIYPSGVTSAQDPQWKTAFESPYKKFIEAPDRDFWMTVGNHDRRSSIDAQLRYSERSPIWKMPGEDYAIPGLPKWLNIYVLDTTFIAKGGDIPTFQSAIEKNFQEQLQRAAAHLCKKPGWRILATHHPLVSNGARNNRFRENNVYAALYPFIEKCDVNLVLSGHEHMQQHVQMDGVEYLIQGAAGYTRMRAKPFQYESALSRYLDYQLGFGHLLFTKKKVVIHFNDSRGKSIYTRTLPLVDPKKKRLQAHDNFL
jgi:tartrate-resistant acid phosphatase type 5